METIDDAVSQIGDDHQLVPLQIFVPELVLQKCFHVNREELIWDIKQQILSSLPKELKESFNYGLYCPPVNGKAGKFLDEERPIADYPLTDAVAYLELRYKRRVYKMMNVEEKQIKQLHTRANLRRMLEHVANNNVEKVTKLCSRGIDPNFHCPDSGETPLTLASGLKNPTKVIIALVNGGALLDFRTKDGRTALHRAVEKNNLEALKTLLDLGASPNYKDARGLTPLYYTVVYNADPQLTELLLHDHAQPGTADPQGWQEVHQACKHGLVQHLEHLLFYGADMNARNASGNTPLHVCAVNDQESCARVLLFRGADPAALNFANQNPYQVAVIAGNLALADVIKNHRPEDVVPYREPPQYNPRRRASSAALSRTHSDPRLELVVLGAKPPSPCPSNRSLPPFSSSSTISEASSTGSSSTTTTTTTTTHGGTNAAEDSEGSCGTSTSATTDKSATSDSSGVCTSNSGASCDSGTENSDSPEVIIVGTTCVCVTEYQSPLTGHLALNCGDIVQVTQVSDTGMIEGRTRDGRQGLFPIAAVQEVKLRPGPSNQGRVKGRREMHASGVTTLPRRWRMYGEPRTVILHKSKKGFGFVLRGAKATSPLMERQPTENWPSLQYLDDVDIGGVADLAGLRKGDFLLEINGQDVSQASHEHVVSVIRQSGDLVAMTVVSVVSLGGVESPPQGGSESSEHCGSTYRQCATLPRKLSAKKAPAPPKRDPRTTLSVGRARARSMVAGLTEIEVLDKSLNEYDSEGRSTKSSSIESIPKNGAPAPASATTTVENVPSTQSSETPRTASIRSRPSSRRMTAAELEAFLTRQSTEQSAAGTPRVYGSVAAMKRSRARAPRPAEGMKDSHSVPDLNATEFALDKRRSRSQDDLALALESYQDSWRSIEDIYARVQQNSNRQSQIYAETLPLTKKEKASHPVRCPPPSHPPPPPPVGQVVKVDVSQSIGDYANVDGVASGDSKVMSSFRPGDSAKLYASPESVVTVGYKAPSDYQRGSMTQPRPSRTPTPGSSSRSHSLPPRIPNRTSSMEPTTTEASRENVVYSTFRVVQPTPTDASMRSLRGKKLRAPPSTQATTAFQDESRESEPYIPEPDYDSTDEESSMPRSSVDHAGALGTFKATGSPAQSAQNSVSEELSKKDVITSPHSKTAKAEPTTQQTSQEKPLSQLEPTEAKTGRVEAPSNKKEEIEHRRPQHYAQTSSRGETIVHIKRDPLESEKLVLEVSTGSVKENISAFEKRSVGGPQKSSKQRRQQNIDEPLHMTQDDASLRTSKSCPKDFIQDEMENSSSGVSSDVETQNERHESSAYDQASLVAKRLSAYYLQRQQSAEDMVPPSVTASAATLEALNRRNIRTPMGHGTAPRPSGHHPLPPSATASLRRPQEKAQSPIIVGGIPKKTLKIRLDQKVHATRRDTASRAVADAECSSLRRSIDESLQFIRLQVDSLGLSSVNEAEPLTDLVPPPPEFSTRSQPHVPPAEPIAPPPEFSDECRRTEPPRQPSACHYSHHAGYYRMNGSPQHAATLRPTSTMPHHRGGYDTAAAMQAYRPGYGTVGRKPDPHVLVVPVERQAGDLARLKSVQREFRQKPLMEWSARDVSDWLESLFLQEYRPRFVEAGITGVKLANMDSNDFMGLGVKQVGHRLNMERSLRRYMK
uniref:Putative ankyrin n=1 Tax=Ornithodoros turicata TaxID=34597 RepID=A0A2R5L8X2_9ACAR